GDPARARDLVLPVVKQSFSNKWAYYLLALVYHATGDTAMERTELLYSQRVNPNLVKAMARLRALSH
ncbi:MAG: hypothetical protein ACPL3S_03885, partial [Halothiobacillaceae bacterium]